jgi:hypothetical protein
MWFGGWMDGWMGGFMDGGMDVWMKVDTKHVALGFLKSWPYAWTRGRVVQGISIL